MSEYLEILLNKIQNTDITEQERSELIIIIKKLSKDIQKKEFQVKSLKKNSEASKQLLTNTVNELNEINTQFNNTINNLEDVYYRVDFQGNLLEASPSICNKMGLDSIDEIIGLNIKDLFYKNPNDRVLFLEKIKKDGRVTNYQIEFVNKVGELMFGVLNSVIWNDENGNPAGIEGIVHDLTDRVYNEKRLTQLNEELLKTLENVEAQNTKIETQNHVLKRQAKLVLYQQKQLKESIEYAKLIQYSILSDTKILNKVFPDNFIYYDASSIVSGDFYFFQEIDNYFIIAVADCTGHGVPGGFMTMLGITFIDEIIRREDVNTPNKALELLRNHIKRALKQERKNLVKDGLDIAMCAIQKDTLEMDYSGANIPLFIVKNNHMNKEIINFKDNPKIIVNDAFIEVKPDNMPIGFYYDEKTFSKQTLKLKKGDIIYLATDGYSDQFGGNYGRKYLKKNFKKLLYNIHQKSMKEQKDILINNFWEWKKDFPQIDDILVVGFRI